MDRTDEDRAVAEVPAEASRLACPECKRTGTIELWTDLNREAQALCRHCDWSTFNPIASL